MKSAHFLRASLPSDAPKSRAGEWAVGWGSSQLSCNFPLNWGRIGRAPPSFLLFSHPHSLQAQSTCCCFSLQHSAEPLPTSHFPLNTCLHTSICSLEGRIADSTACRPGQNQPCNPILTCGWLLTLFSSPQSLLPTCLLKDICSSSQINSSQARYLSKAGGPSVTLIGLFHFHGEKKSAVCQSRKG